jgi:predicted RNA-binding protein
MASSTRRYWLIVTSHDHTMRGVEGGFCQANHGKKAPIARMKKGDGVLIYSPKEKHQSSTPCQKFTAVGTVKGGEVFQAKMTPTFEPWRRSVGYEKAIRKVDVRPLVQDLGFIKNKDKWGSAFRFGFIQVPENDFEMIRDMMTEEEARRCGTRPQIQGVSPAAGSTAPYSIYRPPTSLESGAGSSVHCQLQPTTQPRVVSPPASLSHIAAPSI